MWVLWVMWVIELDKLPEGLQCCTALDALAGLGDAVLKRQLPLLQHLNAKGCVGQNDIRLSRQSLVLQHGIEDFLGFLFRSPSHQLFGLGRLESQITGREDALVVVGSHLEVASQGYLVVAIDAVDDAIVDTQTLVNLLVESHLVKVSNTQELTAGLAGIDQGT